MMNLITVLVACMLTLLMAKKPALTAYERTMLVLAAALVIGIIVRLIQNIAKTGQS